MKLLGMVAVCRPVRPIHGGENFSEVGRNDAMLYLPLFGLSHASLILAGTHFSYNAGTRIGEAAVTREFQAKF